MAGAFAFTINIPVSVAKAGAWRNMVTNGGTDQDLIDGWQQGLRISNLVTGNLSGSLTYSLDQNTAIIDTETEGLVSFNGLPSGFTLKTAEIRLYGAVVGVSWPGGPPLPIYGYSVIVNWGTFGNISENLDSTQGTAGSFWLPNPILGVPQDWEFIMPIMPLPIMLDLINNNIELIISVGNDRPPGESFEVFNIIIEGTYDLDSFQYELNTPTNPVAEGTPITATSPDTDGIDYTQVDSVTVTYPGGSITVDPSDWILIEPHLFTFIMPSFGGDTPPIITISITSTQFSGSITLGSLTTIYFTSASGLYRLIPGARVDELYIEDEPGATITVKIPNPSFRTGFIGS